MIDARGVDICLHLDPPHTAHFDANTQPPQPGPTSAFAATLTDTNGAALATGVDLTVGVANPSSFMQLDWALPDGQTRDVILHVSAKSAAAQTPISVGLFDPLE